MIVEYIDGQENYGLIIDCVGLETDAKLKRLTIKRKGDKLNKIVSFKTVGEVNRAYEEAVKSMEKWIKILKENK